MRSVKNWMPPFFRHPSIPPRPTRVEGEDSRDFVEAVLVKSQDLYQIVGDCGDEYRR
ncbi:MAG: hypothetical protein RID09_07205 [Coleofasciculus sp. G1-WW12-02]|uniref:hypothetical protein n=1 Tax=Coleofasciculus sp. G1-WW12-02 TaxID=3068483 RepID=UPI0032FCE219